MGDLNLAIPGFFAIKLNVLTTVLNFNLKCSNSTKIQREQREVIKLLD
jgi:hypothetical protein